MICFDNWDNVCENFVSVKVSIGQYLTIYG